MNNASLTRILNVYANFDPETGYAQGMNFIVSMIIFQVMNCQKVESVEEYEDEIFAILLHIMGV